MSESVVNRIPVDTATKELSILWSKQSYLRTSRAPLLCADIKFCSCGNTALESTASSIFLVHAFWPGTNRGAGILGRLCGVAEPAKIMQHAHSPHPIFSAPGILGAPFSDVVLQAEHDITHILPTRSPLSGEAGSRVGDGSYQPLYSG